MSSARVEISNDTIHRQLKSSKTRRVSLSDPIIAKKDSFLSKSSFTQNHDMQDIWKAYTKLSEVGEGATGVVMKVKCKESSEILACKIVDKKTMEKDALEREIELLKVLDHPNVIRLREVWKNRDDHMHVVMELAKGADLYTELRNVKFFGADVAATIFIDIVKAVRYIHKMGVVHRDLKLQNFVFEHPWDARNDACPPPVKLIDFGYSELYYLKPKHMMKDIVGTSYFVAPEVVENPSAKAPVQTLSPSLRAIQVHPLVKTDLHTFQSIDPLSIESLS